MNDDLSTAGLPTQLGIAALCGGICYLVVTAALHVVPWQAGASGTSTHYLAIGAGLLVGIVVLIRIRRGTWGSKHVDEMLNIDLDD